MKVLMINGSPNEKGCTYTALCHVAAALEDEGVEHEIVWLGNGPIRDCIDCGGCAKTKKCVFTDDVISGIIEKAEAADGFVFGSPVYYAHPSGRILSIMDRLFFPGGKAFAYKPAAAVVSARRAGTTASLDVLNKYFAIARMPVVSSTYWNMVHGTSAPDVAADAEGIQTMRNIGHGMAWLMKCIELGKQSGITPTAERGAWTNFVR